MQKETKRAERRHHLERLKEKVVREGYYGRYWDGAKISYIDRETGVRHQVPFTEEERQQHIKRIAENGQMCSCYMCGNPRKHFDQVTPQEIKSEMDFEEQLDEALEELDIEYYR